MKIKTRLKSFAKPQRSSLIIWIIIFASVGTASLLITRAATPLQIDSTLPTPTNLKTFLDDRNVTVTWNSASGSRVVGYYITYRPRGSSEEFKVRQTEYNVIQLQPLTNGTEYEIFVQSVAGTNKKINAGPLVYGGNNNWKVADGKVSNKSAAAYATPSSARVDAMRQRLTGFFDDFNTAAGPMDELKWNNATTACARAGSAAAFVNDQFHTHNTVGSAGPNDSYCDRAGIASRPRATFDMSSVTEANPGQIEFDMDGATHHRDTWYLDIIPLSARTTKLPLDITSHADASDSDSDNPGNMIRINSGGRLTIPYYNTNQVSTGLNVHEGATACSEAWDGPYFARLVDSCDLSKKTGNFSPLPEPSFSPSPIPNVRRHWVVQFTPTKIKVFMDSALIASAKMPEAFFAEKKYTVHSTVFSYNTGKTDGFEDGSPIPSIEMVHWDNFGFNGPAPAEIAYSYLEGGATGTNPTYANGDSNGYRVPKGSRKTIIPIPDPIGNIVNGQANLYYTIGGFDYDTYTWKAGDHILVNGKRYDTPNPNTQMAKAGSPLTTNFVVAALTIPIAKADLVQGNNTIEFKFGGGASFINVHMELSYLKSDNTRPAYTQPSAIFGTKFYDISQPPIMNCDQYRYVEQDLGLPYQTGKANIPTGTACTLLPKGSHHTTDPGGTSPNPSDTVAPTTSISDPANSATLSGTKVVTASASDNVGVAKVEFLVDGAVKETDTTSPYSFSWNTTSVSDGSHTLQTRASDATGNSALSGVVTVTIKNTSTPVLKPGDVNGDNLINIFDISIILSNWNKTGATRAQGDVNTDGAVNIFDISVVLSNWGK